MLTVSSGSGLCSLGAICVSAFDDGVGVRRRHLGQTSCSRRRRRELASGLWSNGTRASRKIGSLSAWPSGVREGVACTWRRGSGRTATACARGRTSCFSGNFRMARNSALNVSVGVIAAVMICFAAFQASQVFAPLTLALFPSSRWCGPCSPEFQARMPALLALAITMTVTVAVCIAFASLAVWGFGRVGVSLIAEFRALSGDLRARDRLARRPRAFRSPACGASISMSAGSCTGRGQITGRVNTTLSFWLIALLYVILGLMEVDVLRRRAKTFLPTGGLSDSPARERRDGE